jgi:transcriptional regulator with XRE-family HTH domain
MRKFNEFKLTGVGKRLKEIRKHFNLTQEEIAKKLEMTADGYLRNERDHNHPGYQTMDILFREFKVSLDWLLMGHGEMLHYDKIEYDQLKDFITDSPQELIDLIRAMSQVPLLYHEQMTHFHRFMMNNKELLVPIQKSALSDNDGDPALKHKKPILG